MEVPRSRWNWTRIHPCPKEPLARGGWEPVYAEVVTADDVRRYLAASGREMTLAPEVTAHRFTAWIAHNHSIPDAALAEGSTHGAYFSTIKTWRHIVSKQRWELTWEDDEPLPRGTQAAREVAARTAHNARAQAEHEAKLGQIRERRAKSDNNMADIVALLRSGAPADNNQLIFDLYKLTLETLLRL